MFIISCLLSLCILSVAKANDFVFFKLQPIHIHTKQMTEKTTTQIGIFSIINACILFRKGCQSP